MEYSEEHECTRTKMQQFRTKLEIKMKVDDFKIKVDDFKTGLKTRIDDDKMKLLIFTDSRGQHKQGDSQLYWERLADDSEYQVDCYICPYKWTTTLDFLELIFNGQIDPRSYDAIILHTGIVEWSPRSWSNAFNDLYNPVNTRNGKKTFADWLFGEDVMEKYLTEMFSVEYEGEPTMNLYSLDMLKHKVLPYLRTIPNLIWISCNPIILEWRGTYSRDRPENIRLVEYYSEEMTKGLQHVVDLNGWTDAEVKQYTLDNIHLTSAGSDYIYERIIEYLAK